MSRRIRNGSNGSLRMEDSGMPPVGASLLATALALALATTASAAGAPQIRWQASDGAVTVAYSRDRRLIADAGSTQLIQIRNAPDGRLVRSIRDKSGINTLAFSPDSTVIAGGRTNGTSGNLKVYRVADGVQLMLLAGHSNATRSVSYSPDGSLLASGGDDRNVKLWRASDGTLLRTLSDGTRVRSVAFSQDGTLLASAGQGGVVKIWQVGSGALLLTLDGFAGSVSQVAFSPDGTLVAAASLDGTVRLWRTSDGGLVRVITLPSAGGSVASLAFSPNGAALATGNDEVAPSPEHGTVRFYRVSDGRLVTTFDRETDVYVRSIAFHPFGGTFVYVRAVDGVLTVAATPF